MCSNTCLNECGNFPNEIPNKLKSVGVNCQKCKEAATVLLRNQDSLCSKCFLAYCKHKFRATVGKAHLVKPGDRILLSFSGGCASTALLHMVQEAINEESRRKLMIDPLLLFISDGITSSDDDTHIKQEIIFKVMEKSGFPSYYTSLEMFCRSEEEDAAILVDQNLKLPLQQHAKHADKLQNILQSFATLTAKEEFLRRVKDKLLVDAAKFLNCHLVFVGDSASRLSVQMLSGIALGSGSQLGSKLSLKDHRWIVPVSRPLREFLAKELALYNHLKGNTYVRWPSISSRKDGGSSIFRLTESFVTGLQSEFPATTSTIFRIGAKLKSSTHTDSRSSHERLCSLCHSPVESQGGSMSAAKALVFSEKISSVRMSRNEMQGLCFTCCTLARDMENPDYLPGILNR